MYLFMHLYVYMQYNFIFCIVNLIQDFKVTVENIENTGHTGHLSVSLECMRKSIDDLSSKRCLFKDVLQ